MFREEQEENITSSVPFKNRKSKKKRSKLYKDCKPWQFKIYFALGASSDVHHIENTNLLMQKFQRLKKVKIQASF